VCVIVSKLNKPLPPGKISILIHRMRSVLSRFGTVLFSREGVSEKRRGEKEA